MGRLLIRGAIMAVLLMVFCTEAIAQKKLISSQSVRERQAMIKVMQPDSDKAIAIEYARRNNLPVRLQYRDGTLLEIRRISPTGKPLYYKTFNLDAARTISSNLVWEGGTEGLALDGAGIVIGMWDGGIARSTHREFDGRVRIIDPDSEVIDHATHVAGTLAATGENELAHGMANGSTVDSYNWDNDNDKMRNAALQGLLISNNSYGFVQGWQYDEDKSRWEWWGDESISETEDYKFGYYGIDAKAWDDIAYDHQKFLIVKSAGNDRGEGPAAGARHFVLSDRGWIPSTATRELDGGLDSYDCIGMQSTAKNILAVGAVPDIPDGFQEKTDVKVSSFTVFGPTDDGRIKPDIVGNGTGLFSSTSESDDSYGFSTGTSMSAPNIAGSLALLQQLYRSQYGEFMFASQLKALVLHTADDAGNPGPDYKFGWGLMNTASAASLISRDNPGLFFHDTLTDQETKTIDFYSSGQEEIRVTIVWTDPPGEVPPVKLNPTNRILVNDLDIKLTRALDGHQFRSFVLDPANPSSPATAGDNSLDNVEQISIEQPFRGFYSLDISSKGSLEDGEQTYAIVISGLSKDFVASGLNVQKESNGTIMLSSAEEYINDMDVQWLIEPANGLPVSLYFDFFDTEEGKDILSIYDGTDPTASLIARFSGSVSDRDTVVSSTAGPMYITFTSDSQNTAKGFMARYCTVAPEGDFQIVGDSFPCRSTISSYFAVGQDGAEYDWEVDKAWALETRSSNGVDLTVGDENGLLRLKPFNRCGNSKPSELLISPLNATPELEYIEGDTLPCANHPATLVTNRVPGTTYEWQIPASWLGTSESDTLYYIPSGTGESVLVTGMNACGKGNTVSKYIDVQDIPVRTNILTDRVPPCAFTTQEFYIEPEPGHTYKWEVQDDWSILDDSINDTVTVQIGGSANFIFVTAANKCGATKSNRLMLTAPIPPLPELSVYSGVSGFPEILVVNRAEMDDLQWYRDNQPIPGDVGRSSYITVYRNGLYTAKSISEEGCTNLLPAEDGINIETDRYRFHAYRLNGQTIIIENTSSARVDYNIVSVSGVVQLAGILEPGINEIPFSIRGIFLVHFFSGGVDQVLKAYF